MNAPTRRLGRGLGSLIAEGGQGSTVLEESPLPVSSVRAEEHQATEGHESDLSNSGEIIHGNKNLIEIPIGKVVPNPHQPRKVIDPEAVKELAASIKSEGLLQPVVVRPTDHGYELIAGERRMRAHQYLGQATILARVLEVTDLSSASLSLIENLQREELNPVEEAMGYQSLISDFNLSQQDVADRMGKSRSHIANLLRLLKLDNELKRLLSDGELSVGHAKVLLGIDDPDRRLSIGRQAVLEGWTVRQIEDALSAGLAQASIPIPRKAISSQTFTELAQSVSLATGRKVIIKNSAKGKGMISFSFEDENDLRNFLTKFEN